MKNFYLNFILKFFKKIKRNFLKKSNKNSFLCNPFSQKQRRNEKQAKLKKLSYREGDEERLVIVKFFYVIPK